MSKKVNVKSYPMLLIKYKTPKQKMEWSIRMKRLSKKFSSYNKKASNE